MPLEFSANRLLNAGASLFGNRDQKDRAADRIDRLNAAQIEDAAARRRAKIEKKEAERAAKRDLMLKFVDIANDNSRTSAERQKAAQSVAKLSENLGIDMPTLGSIGELSGGDYDRAKELLEIRESATPESFAEFTKSKDPSVLEPKDEKTERFNAEIDAAENFLELAAMASPESFGEYLQTGDRTKLRPREEPVDPAGTEFERLIEGLPPEQQAAYKARRLEALVTEGGGGISVESGPDGGTIVRIGGQGGTGPQQTDSQAGKEVSNFKDLRASSKTLLDDISTFRQDLSGNEEAITASGAIARFVDNATSQISALSNLFGVEVGDDLSPPEAFEELAGKSAGLQSALYSMAIEYAITINKKDSRLSDFDVKQALKVIGAKEVSATQLGAKLDFVADKVARRLIVEATDRFGEEQGAQMREEVKEYLIERDPDQQEKTTDELLNEVFGGG